MAEVTTPEIRGEPPEEGQMLLGQIRKIFGPSWLQWLSEGSFTVQFVEQPSDDLEQSLIQFAEMYGYDLKREEDRTWVSYYFHE